jgi:hypothetical protein
VLALASLAAFAIAAFGIPLRRRAAASGG